MVVTAMRVGVDDNKPVTMFDPDAVDLPSFFPENEDILWTNVVDSVASVSNWSRTPNAAGQTEEGHCAFQMLHQLHFAVQMYVSFSRNDYKFKCDRIKTAIENLIYATGRTNVTSLSHEDAKHSANCVFVLYQIMRKIGIEVDTQNELEVAVKLSLLQLNFDSNIKSLIKLIESKDLFSSQLIGELKHLVRLNPVKGRIVIELMNDLLNCFVSRQPSSFVPRFGNYNFVITDSLQIELEHLVNEQSSSSSISTKLLLFLILPNDQIDDERAKSCLQSILNQFKSASDEDIFNLYLVLFSRTDPKVSKIMSDMSYKSSEVIDPISGELSVDNCLILAKKERKHFVNEIIEIDILSPKFDKLSRNFKLITLISKLYKLMDEQLDSRRRHRETSVSSVRSLLDGHKSQQLSFIIVADKLQSLINTSTILLSSNLLSTVLVQKLKAIFDFTDWTLGKLDIDPFVSFPTVPGPGFTSTPIKLPAVGQDIEETIKESMIKSFLNSRSPLEVLSNLDLINNLTNLPVHAQSDLEIEDSSFEETINELESLLKSLYHQEVAVFNGFLAIKLTLIWLVNGIDFFHKSSNVSSDGSVDGSFDDDIILGPDEVLVEDELDIDDGDEREKLIKKLINKCLMKINNQVCFKTEILENMFSILFCTKSDLKQQVIDAMDADEFNDTSDFSNGSNSTRTNNNYLVSNEIVPKFLLFLKDSIFETQSALRNQLMGRSPDDGHDEDDDGYMRTSSINCSIQDLNECKIRLNNLLNYINDASWRYSVIEPAFRSSSAAIDDNDSIGTAGQERDTESLHSARLSELRSLGTRSDSRDTDQHRLSRQSSSTLSTKRRRSPQSVIPCMLASPCHLLKYCLLEGQFDRAKQVYKLFESQLTGSEQVLQLVISEKRRQMSETLRSMYQKHLGRIPMSQSVHVPGHPVTRNQMSSSTMSLVSKSSIGTSATGDQLADYLVNFKEQLVNESSCSEMQAKLILIDYALSSAPSLRTIETCH